MSLRTYGLLMPLSEFKLVKSLQCCELKQGPSCISHQTQSSALVYFAPIKFERYRLNSPDWDLLDFSFLGKRNWNRLEYVQIKTHGLVLRKHDKLYVYNLYKWTFSDMCIWTWCEAKLMHIRLIHICGKWYPALENHF